MTVRAAQENDLEAIIALIRGLAEYERQPEAVVLDPDMLRAHLFGPRPAAEVLIAETSAGEVAGFALYFTTFSTWLGRPGLWLEDLFVWPQFRGCGYGRALLAGVAAAAEGRGYGRVEWSALDWNAPAIGFYRALGAQPMDEWTSYRLEGEAIARVAALADGPVAERP